MVWTCVLIVALALAFFGRDTLRSLLPTTTRPPPRRSVAADSLPALSAAWLLAECGRLASIGADWPAICAAINPSADPEIDALLGRLRAAHSGAVADILKTIADGCRTALADNPEAGAFDALSVATRASQWTSTAKW